MSAALGYRPATADDRRFVADSWIRSYRTAHAAGMILYDDWPIVMERSIRRVIAREGCRVVVAYRPGETDRNADLYGWIAAEPEARLVHYAYVKKNFRRLGIARGLFRAVGIDPRSRFDHTCKTEVLGDLRRAFPGARWRPLVARIPQNPNL